MNTRHGAWKAAMAMALLYSVWGAAQAQGLDPAQQAIRRNLGQRLQGFPKIDEVRPSGMPGLYEVRVGHELYYSDAQGAYLIRGELIDTRSQRNLTQERIKQLSAIDFAQLPLQDAVVWKVGNGQRRIAVFADPNCGYCKKLEAELQHLKDVTVYTFLYPVLAQDSVDKAKNVWCSGDATQSWRAWMLKGQAIKPGADCATPIERNLAFGRAHRIEGVPAIFFEDGSRSAGALSAQQIEARLERLAAASSASSR